MTLFLNSNILAVNSVRTLGNHYSRLSASVRRLSSGLRINSAADDAAGLAIRELMRADIASYHQGVRNADDAISMIQTADGALSVIDEKLIRMKELAMQAATGTYNSTQRLIIDSEFQAMGSEIDRIAHATDFNGIKLLDGSLSGKHDGSRLAPTGAMKIHFGPGNDSAEDYYYVEVGDCTLAGLGLREIVPFPAAPPAMSWINEAQIDHAGRQIILDIPDAVAGRSDAAFMVGLDFYALPVGLENITVTSNAILPNPVHKPHVSLFTSDGTQLTGPIMPTDRTTQYTAVVDSNGTNATASAQNWWNTITPLLLIAEGQSKGIFDPNASFKDGANLSISMQPGSTVTAGSGADQFTITTPTGQNEVGSTWTSKSGGTAMEEILEIDRITSDLVFFIGGHNNPSGGCNRYRLRIEADITEDFLQKLKVWAGDESLDAHGEMLSIETQEKAQSALAVVNEAIVRKDNIRAHLGALQNRLENTVSNLQIQAENLQAAESRISDVDVAREMTDFVRNQILTQSGTAMLAQGNFLPRMLIKLLGG